MHEKRIQIRHAEVEDCSSIHSIFSAAKTFAETLQLPYPSLEGWRRRLATRENGVYYLVAEVGDHGIVGMLGFHTFPDKPRRNHAGTFGIAVHEEWHGKGVGKALLQAALELADNWLNLKRLEIEVYTDNAAAIRLYERFGFEREGTLRMHAFREGRYVDSYAMARIRP